LLLSGHPGMAAERTAADCGRPLDEYRIRTWTRQHGLPLDTVYSVAQTPYGFLWVGTEDGAVRFDGTEFEEVDLHPETAVRRGGIRPCRG
jgi:ligand-binding sensor domain-containing protein